MGQKSLIDIIKWKLVFAVVLGTTLWFVSGALHFPTVFQIMFVGYAALGFVVFVMLDLPPLPELSGFKSLLAVIAFFVVVSAVYTAVGVLLPQYDPAWEKGKIAKIIMAKKRANPVVSPNEVNEKAKELTEQTEDLMYRLASLERAMTGESSVGVPTPEELAKRRAERRAASTEDPVAYGEDVYDLYECYNCHKIGGKGGVKKRGPHLDNIGNEGTVAELKKKILEPKAFMAEGFKKEFKKGMMPDKYPELMTDEEIDALVAYLATLTDTSVKTPKMIPQ